MNDFRRNIETSYESLVVSLLYPPSRTEMSGDNPEEQIRYTSLLRLSHSPDPSRPLPLFIRFYTVPRFQVFTILRYLLQFYLFYTAISDLCALIASVKVSVNHVTALKTSLILRLGRELCKLRWWRVSALFKTQIYISPRSFFTKYISANYHSYVIRERINLLNMRYFTSHMYKSRKFSPFSVSSILRKSLQ